MIATRIALAALLGLGLSGIPSSVWAQGRVVHGGTRTSVNQTANVNRNVNVNRDIDVDVDRDYHPIARTAAVATTAVVTTAVVGSVVHSLPQACTTTRWAMSATSNAATPGTSRNTREPS